MSSSGDPSQMPHGRGPQSHDRFSHSAPLIDLYETSSSASPELTSTPELNPFETPHSPSQMTTNMATNRSELNALEQAIFDTIREDRKHTADNAGQERHFLDFRLPLFTVDQYLNDDRLQGVPEIDRVFRGDAVREARDKWDIAPDHLRAMADVMDRILGHKTRASGTMAGSVSTDEGKVLTPTGLLDGSSPSSNTETNILGAAGAAATTPAATPHMYTAPLASPSPGSVGSSRRVPTDLDRRLSALALRDSVQAAPNPAAAPTYDVASVPQPAAAQPNISRVPLPVAVPANAGFSPFPHAVLGASAGQSHLAPQVYSNAETANFHYHTNNYFFNQQPPAENGAGNGFGDVFGNRFGSGNNRLP